MRITTNVFRIAPTGGVEVTVLEASRELASRGHSIQLLYREGGSFKTEYEAFCRSVEQVGSVNFDFGSWQHPRQQIRKVPVVLRATSGRPDIFYTQQLSSSGWAIPAKRLVRKPIVCHIHGFRDFGPDGWRWFNRNVDRFVVVSKFVADQHEAVGLDPRKIEVVHNGVDPEDYPFGGAPEQVAGRAALGLADDLYVVVFLGRLVPEKGVEVLLDAWRLLGLGPDEGRLLVVGPPDYADGEAYAAQLRSRATDSVQFLPMQRGVVPYLHAADVSVTPSVWEEPFGRVIVETLSTGRPALASRVGGIPEILDALPEFMLEPGDAPALAEALGKLKGWQERRPELATICRDHVEKRFTLRNMVDRLENAFEVALSS